MFLLAAPLCILFADCWPHAWCHGCSEVTTFPCPEGPQFKSSRTCYCPKFACSLWCLWVFSWYSGFLHKDGPFGISEWTFGVSVNGFHADSAWAGDSSMCSWGGVQDGLIIRFILLYKWQKLVLWLLSTSDKWWTSFQTLCFSFFWFTFWLWVGQLLLPG